MSLRERASEYIDNRGFIQNRDRGQDGNLNLYTGTYYVLLHRLGEENFRKDLVSFRHSLIYVEKKPGVIIRAYKPREWQADDDYRGLCAASFFVEPPERTDSFAKRTLAHGRSNSWSWLGVEGKWYDWRPKAFFARKPSFKPLIKACAGERLSVLEQVMVAVDILWTLYQDDGFSGYILDYLTIQVMRHPTHNYWLLNKAMNYFEKKFMERYPTGMAYAFTEFFNAQYPFSAPMKGKF